MTAQSALAKNVYQKTIDGYSFSLQSQGHWVKFEALKVKNL